MQIKHICELLRLFKYTEANKTLLLSHRTTSTHTSFPFLKISDGTSVSHAKSKQNSVCIWCDRKLQGTRGPCHRQCVLPVFVLVSDCGQELFCSIFYQCLIWHSDAEHTEPSTAISAQEVLEKFLGSCSHMSILFVECFTLAKSRAGMRQSMSTAGTWSRLKHLCQHFDVLKWHLLGVNLPHVYSRRPKVLSQGHGVCSSSSLWPKPWASCH